MDRPREREVPEIGNMYLREKIVNNLDLVDEETVAFLSTIPTGSKIIEIEGGMGEVSEHLSELGNKVSLVGEHRLFFVYREQTFPGSKVIPMNLNPDSIKAGDKPYYDYAIVHGSQYITLAKSIAAMVYDVSSKEVITGVPAEPKKENNAKELVNSVEKPVVVPENKVAKESTGSSVTSDNTVPVEQVTKSDPIADSIPSDNKPVSDLE